MKIRKITKEEITRVIKDEVWQEFRISLKGTSTEFKLKALDKWAKKSEDALIQAINYYNALKRGGQIK